jgi:hypothetical protein
MKRAGYIAGIGTRILHIEYWWKSQKERGY